MNNESIITRVDESTKELMKEVQDGLKSGITDDVEVVVKNGVKGLKEDTETIVRKLNNFSGLQSSLDELKELAQSSKDLLEEETPIDFVIEEMKEKLVAINDCMVHNNSETKNQFDSVNNEMVEIRKSINANQNDFAGLNKKLDELSVTVEKVQLTLDIIVNLVTPFWKRKFVEEKQKEINSDN